MATTVNRFGYARGPGSIESRILVTCHTRYRRMYHTPVPGGIRHPDPQLDSQGGPEASDIHCFVEEGDAKSG
jgi:hypothetical protein